MSSEIWPFVQLSCTWPVKAPASTYTLITTKSAESLLKTVLNMQSISWYEQLNCLFDIWPIVVGADDLLSNPNMLYWCCCLMNNENKIMLTTAELLGMTCFSSLTCSCENFLIMVKFYAQYCVHMMVKSKESQEICTWNTHKVDTDIIMQW